MNTKASACMSVCRRALLMWTCLQLTLTGYQITETLIFQILYGIRLVEIKKYNIPQDIDVL